MPKLREDDVLHLTAFLPSERLSAEAGSLGVMLAYAPSFVDIGTIQTRCCGAAMVYAERYGDPEDHFPPQYLADVEEIIKKGIRNVTKVVFEPTGRATIFTKDDWGPYEYVFRLKLSWFE